MMEQLIVLAIALPIAATIIIVVEIIQYCRMERWRAQLRDEMSERGQAYIEENPDDPFVQALEQVVNSYNR